MNQHATKFLGSSLKSVKTSPHKLGDLLTKAGYVTQRQIDELSHLFSDTASVQLGQMLILARHINHDDLAAALRAQALVRDNIVDAQTAIRALQMRRPLGITFDEALERIQQQQTQPTHAEAPTNRLGELLVESGVLSAEKLGHALNKSSSTGLPLGRILVLSGAVSESVLFAALNAQVLVRDKSLQREQAVRALTAAQQRQVPIEQSLKDIGLTVQRSRHEIRLGELLCAAALVDEADVTNAIELGLANAIPVGEILIREGIVSKQILAAALEFQRRVRDGEMDLWQAASALRESQNGPTPVEPERNIAPPNAVALDPFHYPDQMERSAHVPPTEPPHQEPTIARLLQGPPKPSALLQPEQQQHAQPTPPQQPPQTTPGGDVNIEFSDFLVLTQIANEQQLKRATQMCAGTEFPLARGLCIMNVSSKGMIDLATEAYLRVSSKSLSLDEAVFIVHFAREAFASQPGGLQAILDQLGWA